MQSYNDEINYDEIMPCLPRYTAQLFQAPTGRLPEDSWKGE